MNELQHARLHAATELTAAIRKTINRPHNDPATSDFLPVVDAMTHYALKLHDDQVIAAGPDHPSHG